MACDTRAFQGARFSIESLFDFLLVRVLNLFQAELAFHEHSFRDFIVKPSKSLILSLEQEQTLYEIRLLVHFDDS